MAVTELAGGKPAVDEDKARAKRKAQRRAGFLRLMLKWHWISAAICLIGMLLFAVTGITLNHAGAIEAKPKTVESQGQLPEDLIAVAKTAQASQGTLPDPIRAWLAKEMDVKAPKAAAIEWTDEEGYVSLPRPGGDGWVTFDAATGEVIHREHRPRGAGLSQRPSQGP